MINTPIVISDAIKWAIGLIEAEGYIGFNLNSAKDKKWIVILKVTMKLNNARAVYKLKSIFGVGQIHRSKDGFITWKLTDSKKFKNSIVPILDTYPFRGKKYFEFLYVKEALDILASDRHKDEKHELLMNLKTRCKLDKQRVTPIYQLPSFLNDKEDSEIISFISRDKLQNLFDTSWIAGFVEGDGSFQINNRLQIVFELGQKNDSFTVFALHKYFDIPSKVKVRKDKSYTMLSTKHPRVLSEIIKTLTGKLLGMKSFELRVWSYAYNTSLVHKKEKAKILLAKIRK